MELAVFMKGCSDLADDVRGLDEALVGGNIGFGDSKMVHGRVAMLGGYAVLMRVGRFDLSGK